MGVFGQLFLQDGVVRREKTPCHSVYDPIRGKAGAVLSRCALQRGAEPGVEGFEVGKAVPQGNIGQVVVGDGKIVQGVLEPYPGQVFVKVDADNLLEQGGNIGAVVLGIVSQIFQRQLGGIVFLHILQQPPGDGAPLKILRQGVEVFWLELGAEMDGEQLEGGFGRKLGVWPALL